MVDEGVIWYYNQNRLSLLEKNTHAGASKLHLLIIYSYRKELSVNISFSVKETVEKRYSVRNYAAKAIESDDMAKLKTFVDALDNPFQKSVNLHFLEIDSTSSPQSLGTYGVIKGATQYIGATIRPEPLALEALGYELEVVMLYLAHLGLGTCWLGGTFNRKGFAQAMQIAEDELFPVITPYGYAAPRKHVQEAIMRAVIRADHRKEWNQLFFQNDFQTPFSKGFAGLFAFPLEMVRFAPSASNKQPWRILVQGDSCHFYEYKEPHYSDNFSYDIQRIDMGIAAAHFDLAAREQGLVGAFKTNLEPGLALPEHFEYVFSWASNNLRAVS